MTENEMRLELFKRDQKKREEAWKKKQAEIFRRVNSTPADKVPKAIEKLKRMISEEYRQKEKAKEYDNYHVAQEHESEIGHLEYEIRALNRTIGIQSFDIGIDFELEGKTWVVRSCDEYGYYCQAYPKGQEDRDYFDRDMSSFEIQDGKIVKK